MQGTPDMEIVMNVSRLADMALALGAEAAATLASTNAATVIATPASKRK